VSQSFHGNTKRLAESELFLDLLLAYGVSDSL